MEMRYILCLFLVFTKLKLLDLIFSYFLFFIWSWEVINIKKE